MDKYQAWVRDGLQKAGKSAKGLAATLGVAPARITEITTGKRRVQLAEVAKIAAYLELPPPSDHVHYSAGAIQWVRVMGRIQAGVWHERSVGPQCDTEFIAGIVDERFPLETQVAYTIGTKCQSAGLEVGDYVIATSSAPVDTKKRLLVVMKIERHGLEALALGEILRESLDVRLLIPADSKNIAVSKANILGYVVAMQRPLA